MSATSVHMEANSELINSIEEIYTRIKQVESEYSELLERVHPNFTASARNLLHYLVLRTFDVREIQKDLSELGLSSISSPEGYTLSNIVKILNWLYLKEGIERRVEEDPLTYKKSRKLIKKNIRRIFGNLSKTKSAHVMVTMPSEASGDYELVRNMIKNGMDIGRINLAHDDMDTWKQIVENIQSAAADLNTGCKIYCDLAGPKIRADIIQGDNKLNNEILIHDQDCILLCKENFQARPDMQFEGKALIPLQISLPTIIDDLAPGESVWFDDGKIGGVVKEVREDDAIILINKTGLRGSKLKNRKGINFPDTELSLPSLTELDIGNLDFLVEHADIIGFSFVRRKRDLEMLIGELIKRDSLDLGIVLKIETNEAFFNLPEMMLTAMQLPSVGVMIARGDLAVEVGFERISEVQEEILWLCEAAHIPVIWATQVLENLAKKGFATRAEISDVSLAVRADCIMLNKGPHILEAIRSLSDIIERMSQHQTKKKGRLRPLKVAERFFYKV